MGARGFVRATSALVVHVLLFASASAQPAEDKAESSPFHTDMVGPGSIETPSADFQSTATGVVEPAAIENEPEDDSFPDAVLVGNDRAYFCTGVLIDKRHVLTAGHCAEATRVGFGNTLDRIVETRISKHERHPHLDVALLTLAQPAIVRTHARRSRAQTTPPLGTIRMIGFGVRDRLRLTGFGTKRQLDVGVDGWGCSRARAVAIGCSPADELLVRGGQGNDTCLGDSGGPVFELVDDQWRLLAITSRGMRPRKVICGEGGIYIRVDRIAGWLQTEVAK